MGCIGADGGSGLAGSVQRSQKSEGFDWLWPVSSGGGTVITSETVFTKTSTGGTEACCGKRNNISP